ncbi:MAG: succinyl-diaminopimelate desuccinylase, partial [Hyphomicrobiales bacterium]|nr:succinyl-diaminopimelate desuccinylase [Hyphomicrobiales bacterium]
MTRAHPHDAVALLGNLIACESVTPADAGALDTLGDFLDDAGFEVNQVIFSEPGTPDIANLFAKFDRGAPHLTFAGHTDVVPTGDENKWTHPPFSAAIENGVLYGRGAADMKGAIAAFAAAARDYLADRGDTFSGTVSFLITGDEEGPAINGTVKLLDWCAGRGEKFDAALVGEPTNPGALGEMIKIGRRGSLTGRLVVHGVQGHVAYPDRAENPVRGMLRLLDALLDPPFDNGSEHFQPSNLEVTTVDVGNPATNVIPAEARAVFNIRFSDKWTPESVEAEIRARLDKAAGNAVRYELAIDHPVGQSFLTAPGTFVDDLVAAIEAETGRRPELSTTGGTSDARFIKDYCPVVEFGL